MDTSVLPAAAPAAAALLSPETIIADALRRWPELAAVFVHRRMACPGCAMAPFMTLREAAEAYGLDGAALMEAFRAALDGAVPVGPPPPPLPHAAG